jgi:hypothetical protein
MYKAIDQFVKGASKIMHLLVLLKAKNQNLRQANEALSKRRRAKKKNFYSKENHLANRKQRTYKTTGTLDSR